MQVQKFKIVLIGDQQVGKTQLCSQLINQNFQADYKKTITCEFYQKIINFDINNQAEILIWDIENDFFQNNMSEIYLYEADYILFVFDQTNKQTLQYIKKMLNNLESIIQNNNIKCGLGQNKIDLIQDNQTFQQDYKTLLEQFKMNHFQFSVKTGQNIQESFIEIIQILSGLKYKDQFQTAIQNVNQIVNSTKDTQRQNTSNFQSLQTQNLQQQKEQNLFFKDDDKIFKGKKTQDCCIIF